MTTRKATPKRRPRTSTFGTARKLASGRWQARYLGPDDIRRSAPGTFDTKEAADLWLAERRVEVKKGKWSSPDAGQVTFGEYAETWLVQRELKPRTRAHYRSLLDNHLLPEFEDKPLDAISTPVVNSWHRSLTTGPTMKAHSYALLRTILGTAVTDEVITRNPCVIRGAGSAKRLIRIEPASLLELAVIVERMPARLRAMVLLAAWCALRFGELAELRRKDIDLDRGAVNIRRGVVAVKGGRIVGSPKSDAGTRKVAIPPHLIESLREHLAGHVDPGPDSLLFPAVGGGHLGTRTLYDSYYPAREAAGRPDLRFHDLRHTGAFLAAPHATLIDLMNRLGHSTPAAALRYQHASATRDQDIAAKLSAFAMADVVPIKRPRRKSAAS